MKIFIILTVLVWMVMPLGAEETLIKIAGEANFAYFKPEVKISPGGDIYIAYQAQDETTGRSEIYLSKYSSTGNVSFVKNLSESSAYSYEPEIDIPGNGTIHVAWADQTGGTHVIKYRYFNGSTWSGIMTFGQVDNSDNIEDLRIAVDESGNVFVVFMYWPAARCIIVSKYGDTVGFEDFPSSGRSKHPDVAADSNFVHILWQYRESDEYTIAYQRRPNRQNGQWQPWMDVGFFGTQRPRLSVDNTHTPHVVFFEDFGTRRDLWYKKWNGQKFDGLKKVSNPTGAETYHYCDISAINPENMIVTMQKGGSAGGKNVGYNWKRNGEWGGFSLFSKTNGHTPAKQSVDLAGGRFFAAVAFAERDEAVYLLLAEEEGGPGGDAPTANFTFSPQTGRAPLDVAFDGSGSSDPDGSIANYQWYFGDGFSGTGQTVVHRFENQGEYTITLTVTDNDGQSGSTSHVIIVDPPNEPPVARFTFSPHSGLYPLAVTFDASTSSDPDGRIVQYEWNFGGEQTGSGQVVVYTFQEKGLYTVTLTVYDDAGDSASASGTVEVLGLLSPLNIAYEAMINRNLFTIQHVYKVTWDPNPGNAQRGANIVRYNIYRKRTAEGTYTYLAMVQAGGVDEYYDRIGTVKENYDYTVTAVDDRGRESDLPAASASDTGYRRPMMNYER